MTSRSCRPRRRSPPGSPPVPPSPTARSSASWPSVAPVPSPTPWPPRRPRNSAPATPPTTGRRPPPSSPSGDPASRGAERRFTKFERGGPRVTGMATRAELAHLLRRAGFGPRAQELDDAERAGFDATLAKLLTPAGTPNGPPMPHLDTDPLVDLAKGVDRATRQ